MSMFPTGAQTWEAKIHSAESKARSEGYEAGVAEGRKQMKLEAISAVGKNELLPDDAVPSNDAWDGAVQQREADTSAIRALADTLLEETTPS